MPRCYMVKKALCNKYINSVARGFESRGRGRSTPSPTNVQPPVSPLKINPYPVALQEKQSSEGKAVSPVSSEFSTVLSSELPLKCRLQKVQDLLEQTADESTLLKVKASNQATDGKSVSPVSSEFSSEFASDLPLKNRLQRVQNLLEESSVEPKLLVLKTSSRIQREQQIQQKQIEQPTDKFVEESSPAKKCTIISIDTFPPGQFPIFRTVKEISKDQSALALVENPSLVLVEKPAPIQFHRVQDVIENAIEECTETLNKKFPTTQFQKQDLKENVIYKCLDSSDKFPSRRLKKVQDVIENVIEQCTPPTVPSVTTAKTTVITRSGTTTTTTILQPSEFRPPTPPPPRLEEVQTRLESTRQTKLNDDLKQRKSSPASSTEGCTSRLEMLSPFRSSPSLSDRFSSSSKSVIVSCDEYQSQNNGMQLFRDRSAAETEAAHDLLELSRSLPPLPQPGVAIGPQNVVEAPATDVQEMRVYQGEAPVYQVNAIFASDLMNSGIYHHCQGDIIYEPSTNATTIIQQTPGDVFIPFSPVQEILFTYATPTMSSMINEQSIRLAPSSMIADQSTVTMTPLRIDAQSIGSPSSTMIGEQSIGPSTTLRIGQPVGFGTSSMVVEQTIGSVAPSRYDGQSIGSLRPLMIAEQSIISEAPSIVSTTPMIVEQSIESASPLNIDEQSIGSSRSSMIIDQSLGPMRPLRIDGRSVGSSRASMIVEQSRSGTPSISGSATSPMATEQSIGAEKPLRNVRRPIGSSRSSMIVGESVKSGTPSISGPVASSMLAEKSIKSSTPSISGSSVIVEQSIGVGISPARSRTSSMLGEESIRSETPSITGSPMIVEQSIGAGMPSTGCIASSMLDDRSIRSGTPSIGSNTSMIVEQSIGSLMPSRIVRQSMGSVTPSMTMEQSLGSASQFRIDEQSIGSMPPSSSGQLIGSATSRIIEQSSGSVRSIILEQSIGSMTPSSMDEQSIVAVMPSRIVEQSIGPMLTPMMIDQPMESAPPLTPPISECSSDIENNNPNWQANLRNKEVQATTDQADSKVAAYTYDTLIVADGRSKNKKGPLQQKDTPEAEPVDNLEVPKAGRYVCCECGKQYATSSNLSRHKQTHRSIDSQSAKKCVYCGKAYVSMPALAMHVLTHKLTHSCGICGKMFSRPWLLQGHLRSHTGEKPYGCAHCGKAFADRSNLRAHMQTHSADKNYECPKCGKSFALKSYLNKHLESACQRETGDDSSNDVDSIVTL